jgi:hypothetical protein
MNSVFIIQNIFCHGMREIPVRKGLTAAKGWDYTGSEILIIILIYETDSRGEEADPGDGDGSDFSGDRHLSDSPEGSSRHERSVMNRSVNLHPAWVADRRWGCRGNEMAINMQRRKTPCC